MYNQFYIFASCFSSFLLIQTTYAKAQVFNILGKNNKTLDWKKDEKYHQKSAVLLSTRKKRKGYNLCT